LSGPAIPQFSNQIDAAAPRHTIDKILIYDGGDGDGDQVKFAICYVDYPD